MMKQYHLLLCLIFCSFIHPILSSHFRFGTISWSSITESYPCTDGNHGPAAVDTPCHLPFKHDNRVHVTCTGHNTTAQNTGQLCTNTCRYPNDGACDDGGKQSEYSLCALGTDCQDCGSRKEKPSFTADASGWCATSSDFDFTKHWGSCKMCTKTKKIRLKVHLAYRRSGVGGTKWIRRGNNNKVGDSYSAGLYINWGDSSKRRSVASPMQVAPGGLSRTWADSLGEFTHDYTEHFLNNVGSGFTITMRSCCRIGSLKNNRNGYYQLQTYVDLQHFKSGGSGPESSQVPMVIIPQSSTPQQFDVSGYSAASGTAANGKLRFSWSSAEDMGIGRKINMKRKRYNGDVLGMSLNDQTGQLSWITKRIKLGLYSASVKVLD
jgi:hypothetical protein